MSHTTNVKRFVAAVGASAVIALAGLGVAVGQEPDADTMAKSSSMTLAALGPLTTQTTAASQPATTVAVPAIKGPAPLPPEEEAASRRLTCDGYGYSVARRGQR